VNAGHNSPIVFRRNHGRCELHPLASGSAPIGALSDSRYASTTFQLEIDDVVVAYTDGVTESQNSFGDFFGHEQLERILCDCASLNAQEILEHIVNELVTYSGCRPQSDDITLVVMQVQAQAKVLSITQGRKGVGQDSSQRKDPRVGEVRNNLSMPISECEADFSM
jgi:phosphoserine phosphatase RsbU/P